MTLRTPSLAFERAKISVVIVIYALMAEYVDPASFLQSSFGRLLWFTLVVEFIRQVWVYRLEVSRQHVQRSKDLRTRWDRFRSRFSVNARFRVRRALAILAGSYVFGLIISGLTERCEGAIQCAILAPKLAVENLPMAIQIFFYMAMGMSQLFVMFYAMTKVGFVKVVMPGTITVTFDDVYGQDEAKAKLQEQVQLLEDADAIEAAGGYMPKGVLVWGPPGPQPLDAPILTPAGWVTMGDLQEGDLVVAADGTPTRVETVFDFEPRQTYTITLDDGTELWADGEHRWPVKTRKQRKLRSSNWKTKQTLDLQVGGHRGATVDAMRGVVFQGQIQNLILDPWALGALIGDGYLKGDGQQVQFSDTDGVEAAELARRGLVVTQHNGIQWGVRDELTELGLYGCLSPSKFIPAPYMLASVAQRKDLLAGLMDTDGSIRSGREYAMFHSTSRQLIEDVVALVQSLGGKAKPITDDTREPNTTLAIYTDFNPFLVTSHKRDAWAPSRTWRYVCSVEPRAIEAVRCIRVTDSEHLYVTNGYLLSHNTGKTMLAKAVANASTKPLILIPPGAFASTFVGINFLKVYMLFKLIRKLSLRHDGVIVFFDEIDSLGSRGAGVSDQHQPIQQLIAACTAHLSAEVAPIVMTGGGGMNEGTLAAFLAGMDGMEEPRGLLNKFLALLGFAPMAPPSYRYMMLGATNRPDALDDALRRAGRFGRDVHVGYPKFEGKMHTFEGYLAKVSHEITNEEVEWSARNLDKATGASIQDIINESLLIAFRDGREVITFHDLMSAMLWKVIGEGEGMHEVGEDNWSVAIHEAGHAVAAHYLNGDYSRIWVGSIERRGRTGGLIASTPIAERNVMPRSAALNQIAVSLASRVAETLVLGEMSNGHGGDGSHATDNADKMIRGGLGRTLSALSEDKRDTDRFEEQVEIILLEAQGIARNVLQNRQDQLEAVAHLLIDSGGTVQGDEIHTLLDRLEEER